MLYLPIYCRINMEDMVVYSKIGTNFLLNINYMYDNNCYCHTYNLFISYCYSQLTVTEEHDNATSNHSP